MFPYMAIICILETYILLESAEKNALEAILWSKESSNGI